MLRDDVVQLLDVGVLLASKLVGVSRLAWEASDCKGTFTTSNHGSLLLPGYLPCSSVVPLDEVGNETSQALRITRNLDQVFLHAQILPQLRHLDVTSQGGKVGKRSSTLNFETDVALHATPEPLCGPH